MALFEEFPAVSKKEWLDRVRSELKGREPETLEWAATAGLQISPFQHASNAPKDHINLGGQREDNTWEIGEYLPITHPKETNQLALEGLRGGINAPLFVWPEENGALSFSALLDNINPAFISLHFDWSQGKEKDGHLGELTQYLQTAQSSKGSVHLHASPQHLAAGQVQEIQSFSKQYPDWRLCCVDGRAFYRGENDTIEELTQTLSLAADYLEYVGEKGMSASEINQQLHIHFLIGTSYLLNIAKLRAWQILWANVLAHYDIHEGTMPPVVAHCLPPAANDMHTNMIRAATQALTAAVGGAERIYVAPAEGGAGGGNSRRTARNVQHLLQLESGIDRVVDPAAGSYYLEGLTKKLAEAVWAKFVDRK